MRQEAIPDGVHVVAHPAEQGREFSTFHLAGDVTQGAAGAMEMFMYFNEVIEARRAEPRDDLISLLDEGLKQLGEIRATQLEMDNTEKWNSQPPEVLREREKAYAQSEQGATSCLTLANATVHLRQ